MRELAIFQTLIIKILIQPDITRKNGEPVFDLTGALHSSHSNLWWISCMYIGKLYISLKIMR